MLAFSIDHKIDGWKVHLENAIAAVREAAAQGNVLIRITDLVRTLDQNAAMWPALRDFARDVPWSIVEPNGSVVTANEDDWKDILTAAFQQETRMARGLDGRVVILGARTSKYGKKQMGEFLTFVRAEGDQRGVRWSAPARDNFDRYCQP